MTAEARTANQLPRFAGANQRLETTVYLNGFEKGLFATLPLPTTSTPAAQTVSVAATTQAPQMRQTMPRSFQIRLIEARATTSTDPVPPGATVPDGEFTAVVEDLEPGLNYKWRLTIDTPAGALVSVPVEIQAVTCPYDEGEEPRPPPKKGPPQKRPPPVRP